jgi:acyl carrier protein
MASSPLDLTESKVKEFLSRFFKNHDLQPEEDIFALGFVNSLLAMQLVAFVEKEFGIKVEDEDLDLDNFRSIAAISRLVAKKRGAVPAGSVG